LFCSGNGNDRTAWGGRYVRLKDDQLPWLQDQPIGKQCRTLAAVIVGAYDAMQEVRCVYRMYIPDLFWKLPNTSQSHEHASTAH
jgi:hypothetical protein